MQIVSFSAFNRTTSAVSLHLLYSPHPNEFLTCSTSLFVRKQIFIGTVTLARGYN